jgi:hypothetical protein
VWERQEKTGCFLQQLKEAGVEVAEYHFGQQLLTLREVFVVVMVAAEESVWVALLLARSKMEKFAQPRPEVEEDGSVVSQQASLVPFLGE